MSTLTAKKCVPCQGGVPPIEQNKRQALLKELKDWEIIKDHHLSKTYTFPNFVSALDWVNKIGTLAEEERHHPDLHLAWGKVRTEIWTHKIDNLTESDFILAAKIDQLG